jgi:hypothetical protein
MYENENSEDKKNCEINAQVFLIQFQ